LNWHKQECLQALPEGEGMTDKMLRKGGG